MITDDTMPRHSHRTPAELAEDEGIAALRSDAPAEAAVKKCSPDRYKVVTLHSSRLFPVRKQDCADIAEAGNGDASRAASPESAARKAS